MTSNIFYLSEEQKQRNTKENAIKKYGRSLAHKKHTCQICHKVYMPIQSNCSYSASFCGAECEKIWERCLK
jgi:hypothetical protein